MLVDGKKIAEDIYEALSKRTKVLSSPPVLTVITCAPNFETKKYLALKEKKATGVGIVTNIIELDPASTTEDLITSIKDAVSTSDGIIVQLPLPAGRQDSPGVDTRAVVESIPPTHDVDALNPESRDTLSPVVGALCEIFTVHGISVEGKLVTIIGSGRLVGLPAYHWFLAQGAHVSVVTKDTSNIVEYTKNADIIVCGAGVPGLLTPEMIKVGAVILDAGTSEEGGELRGDAHASCADKAGLFTPVPGGIGPITIAILLANVVACAEGK